ncbi:MAG: hypothetical protein R2764_13000 [Bacteroidales bacterium]
MPRLSERVMPMHGINGNMDCFDTLYTPKLHIEAGDKIGFYAFSSPWWPGELSLVWVDGQTGVSGLIQNLSIPWMWYTYMEVDVSAAAGG